MSDNPKWQTEGPARNGRLFRPRPRLATRRPSRPVKDLLLRSPQKALLSLDGTISEITGPAFGHSMLGELDNDLIHNFANPVKARSANASSSMAAFLDERGHPVRGVLVEFWQANAGGRYRHKKESYLAPLDRISRLAGRTITDEEAVTGSARSGPEPIPGRTASTTAARTYPFSVFGHGFAPAPDHADVFRGRSDDLEMSDRRADPRRRAIEQLIAALDWGNTVPMDARATVRHVLRGRRSTFFEKQAGGKGIERHRWSGSRHPQGNGVADGWPLCPYRT